MCATSRFRSLIDLPVDIGESELSQIVCGAPNIKSGIKVIVALPGSRIAGNVKNQERQDARTTIQWDDLFAAGIRLF